MNASDALDLTKENIKPLKQGRKPIQLETALKAQSNTEIQQKLNKEKGKYEHAIRSYEGDDPLAPRFEYIKWLEQIYLKHGPESNILPLIEETVQKFKSDPQYTQDPRFVQILINFIENQSNAVELYQTVYNQGLGTKCALFYRAWADLLDRYNDFKRVDQIYMLGIQSKAEPVEELEQAHLQFQLSIARRMINGELSNDESKNSEIGKRQAFNVLKKSETYSGVRHGLGGSVGVVPQINDINGKMPNLRVFEDNNENGFVGIDQNNLAEFAPKGLNKENTVKPGPWTKPKKSSSKVPKPIPTVNFEVHQDNNVECVTKLSGITVPNALRSRKGSNGLSCPVAIFEPPDPSKRVMYCKDKVYAAGRDIQIEEIKYEIYLKQEKDNQNKLNLAKGKCAFSVLKTPTEDNEVKPLKKVIPEDNLTSDDFKVPRKELDVLSQSVTVNTKAAIDLVQQMWNSPCADKTPPRADLISKNTKPILFTGFKETDNKMRGPSNFVVYDENKSPIKNHINDNVLIQQKKEGNNFYVYTEDDDQAKYLKVPDVYIDNEDENQIKCYKIPEVYVDSNDENSCKISKIPEVYVDSNDENACKISKIPEVYVDENNDNIGRCSKVPEVYVDENIGKTFVISEVYVDENIGKSSKVPDVYIDDQPPIINKENDFKIPEVYIDKDVGKMLKKNNIQKCHYEGSMDPCNENKSPFKKIKNMEVNDDMTCSTKAFAFLLSSSTPLAPGKTKTKHVKEIQPHSLEPIEGIENKETEECQLENNLSVIFEASKERNSSSSSGIILTSSSAIDFGDTINPFDEELKLKLLQKKIKFPDERHKSNYFEHDCDIPIMRSEFKLGNNKMLLLSELGKGSYARVVKARPDDKNVVEMALKIQKPACHWEWYISKEIEHRLKDPEKLVYFVNMDNMHIFRNGSIISMQYATHGTLLSLILAYKKVLNRSLPVNVAALFVSQVTSAVKYLHQCQIIHGDLKPDNVIVKSLPNESCQPCLQLIDFGRSIDMTLFPSGTTFTQSVKTADFVCHEMKDNLPWTYQTDYFGLAGIIYMIIMSDYMKTQKIRKAWVLLKPFPRYVDKELWTNILNMLLNVESCSHLPNLDEIIEKLNIYISLQQKVVLKHHFSSLNAIKSYK